MKRILVMALVALVGGTTSVVMVGSAATAGAPVRWVYVESGHTAPWLVGMSLGRAAGFARHHHIKVSVLRVSEDAPKGTVTQESSGGPDPYRLLLVVSRGAPKNPWVTLPGAKGPPVHEECSPSFVVDVDGNGSPALCQGNRVNVATWDYFAPRRPPMYSLGPKATRCQVAAVYDDDHLNLTGNASVYEMAKAYYGWPFGNDFTTQLVNAGPYADNCQVLEESSTP